MRKLGRLSLIVGTFVAIGGGSMVAGPALAAGGGACTLHGTANFHPGPGATSAPFAYDFSGTLSNCGDSSSPSGFGKVTGGITAGQPLTINGVTYQEPVPTGTGSCATGDTAGTSIVHWSDNTDTVIQYTTKSGAAGVVLQGSVLPSITLTNGTNSATITTTKYAGDSAAGVLAFEVADPTQCNAPGGVTTAGIDGWTGIGSQ